MCRPSPAMVWESEKCSSGTKTPNKQTIILRSFTEKVNEHIIHEILKPKFIQVTFAFDYKVAYMGIRLMKDYCRTLCVIISFVIVILIEKNSFFFQNNWNLAWNILCWLNSSFIKERLPFLWDNVEILKIHRKRLKICLQIILTSFTQSIHKPFLG